MRTLQRLLVMALMLVVGLASAAPAFAQDDSDATPSARPNEIISFGEENTDETEENGTPESGTTDDASIIVKDFSSGEDYVSITVTEVVLDFEDYATSYAPAEGHHYVAFELVFENLIGIDRFEFSTYEYIVVPQSGQYISMEWIGTTSDEDYPLLSSKPILGGQTLTGWLFYEVPDDLALDGFYYYDSAAIHRLASLSEGDAPRPEVGDSVSIFADDAIETARITVDDVITNYEEQISYQPPADTQYIAVGVTIENLVENDRFDFSTYGLVLVDEEGRRITPTYMAQNNAGDITILESTDILGGSTLTGYVIFTVPLDIDPVSLYYIGLGNVAMLLSFDN